MNSVKKKSTVKGFLTYFYKNFINNLLFKLLIRYILDRYLHYIQERMVLKKKYKPNIKMYFSEELNKLKFKLLSPSFKIDLDESELYHYYFIKFAKKYLLFSKLNYQYIIYKFKKLRIILLN